MRNLNRTLIALGLFVGALLLATPVVHADRNGKRVEAKIKAAMEEYDMMEFEAAKTLLLEAISVGEKGDKGPELANAYINLGVVYFSGLGDEDAASEAFGNAMAITQEVTIDVGYSTPEMVALLNAAKGQSGASDDGCGGSGIEHRLVDEAATGSAPEIRAKLGSSVGAAGVFVFYRPEGQLEFTKIPMKKSGGCEYVTNIPTRAVQGDFVHYYIAALDKRGKEIERKGSSGSPNIIEVAAASGGSLSVSDENPLSKTHKGDSVLNEKNSIVFLSLAVGSGSGYVSGPTEKTKSNVECCFAPALLHLMPEVGYYLNPQLAISAAFRMGFPVGANVDGHATFAPAGLLRVHYALAEGGEGVMVSGSLGGGVIRNTVQIKAAASDMNTDTTAMGPLLFGAGLGYIKSLGGPMQLVAEVNALAAVTAGIEAVGDASPKSGAQFDANLAVLFAF